MLLEFHPSATEEAEAATDWYAQRSLVAARVFVSELIHAVDEVAEDLEGWPLSSRFPANRSRIKLPKNINVHVCHRNLGYPPGEEAGLAWRMER